MTIIRMAHAILIAAAITQPAFAGTEPASQDEKSSGAVDRAPVNEQICELQRYIAFRDLPTSDSSDSAPSVLEPTACPYR